MATSHGKGVVDGLGGTVKRSVWRYVRSSRGNAGTPILFYQVAKERNPEVNVHFIPKIQIEENRSHLERYWNEIKAVPNTHKTHFVKSKGPYSVVVGDTSQSDRYSEIQIRNIEEAADLEETDPVTSAFESSETSMDDVSGDCCEDARYSAAYNPMRTILLFKKKPSRGLKPMLASPSSLYTVRRQMMGIVFFGL